jgi:hypothetical protein
MDLVELFIECLTQGGYHAVGIAGWLAWLYERREHKELSTHLFDLATAQVESTVKHEGAIHANTRVMERFLDRMHD